MSTAPFVSPPSPPHVVLYAPTTLPPPLPVEVVIDEEQTGKDGRDDGPDISEADLTGLSQSHRFHSEATIFKSSTFSPKVYSDEEDDVTSTIYDEEEQEEDEEEVLKEEKEIMRDDKELEAKGGEGEGEGEGGIDIRKLRFQRVASVRFPAEWHKDAERGLSLPVLSKHHSAFLHPTALHFTSPMNHTEEYWSSRRHRRRRGPKPLTKDTKRSSSIVWLGFKPLSISYWAESTFLLGATFFAIGELFDSIFCYNFLGSSCSSLAEVLLARWAFIVGSIFFTVGSYFYVLEALNQPKIPYSVSSRNLANLHSSKGDFKAPSTPPRPAPQLQRTGSLPTETSQVDFEPDLESGFIEDSEPYMEKGKDKEGKKMDKLKEHRRDMEMIEKTKQDLKEKKRIKKKGRSVKGLSSSREPKESEPDSRNPEEVSKKRTGPSTLMLFLRKPHSIKYWGWKPRLLAYWSSVLSLVASICFVVGCSLTSCTLCIAVIFLVGSVFDSISSLISFFEVCHGWFAFKPKSLSWWIVSLRLFASALYLTGGIAGFFFNPIVVQVSVRAPYFFGSVIFMVASYCGIVEILNP